MRGVLLKPPTSDEPPARRNFLKWESIVQLTPLLAVLAGALWYFVLTVSYNLFYGPMGVSPDEVGYGYTNILRGSMGLLLVSIVAGLLFLSPTYIINYVDSRREMRRLKLKERPRVFTKTQPTIFFSVLYGILVVTTFSLPFWSGQRAQRCQGRGDIWTHSPRTDSPLAHTGVACFNTAKHNLK
jgi:hypothetical protein